MEDESLLKIKNAGKSLYRKGFTIFLFLFLSLVMVFPSFCIVPLEDSQVKELKKQGKLDKIVQITDKFRAKNAQIENNLRRLENYQVERAALGTGSILILLCEFEDNIANKDNHDNDYYQEFFFSKGEMSTGSMRDYYIENSYGKFDIQGEISNWYLMPEPYSYYVNGNYGFSSYPQNAEKMVEELILMADEDIDFSQFDNDGPDGIPNSGDDDGYIDAIFVLHAGPEGAGAGGDAIWSHASYLWHNRPEVDGVRALRYTVCPEASSIGVYAHEYGHTFGLPDLYDTDYSSDGVGIWSMMSGGTHLNGGRTPAHFDAWSKIFLNWLEPIIIDENRLVVDIPQVVTNDVVYLLWTDGIYDNEYFLVSNRQKIMFDSYLPEGGMLIWHVDESVRDNTNEFHPKVHLEQADGLEELNDRTYERGNAGDPYPGSSDNRNFNDETNPNSLDYDGNITHVRVENISDSSSTMRADLFVSHPLRIDAEKYNCESSILVSVFCQNAEGQGSITVEAFSTTETEGEEFDLNEDAENPGNFSNSIQLESAEPIIDGKIQVNDGDIVRIIFTDTEKGIDYEQTAIIDCLAPNMDNSFLSHNDPQSITLYLYVNENSNGYIEYGESTELGNRVDATSGPSRILELTIENLTPCTIYFYKIFLTDEVGNENILDDNGEPFVFETRMDKAIGLTHLSSDFETEDPSSMWVHEPRESYLDEWELGSPETGPESAHSGNFCWGTDLDDNYDAGNDSWLITPEIDLTASYNPMLQFWHWYNIWVDNDSGDDGAWLEVSIDGINWIHLEPVRGYPEILDPDAPYNPSRQTEDLIGVYAGETEDWIQADFSLRKYRGQKIKIRFHFWQDAGDDNGLREGWFIDDVRIYDDNYGVCHRADLQFLADFPNCSFPLPVYLSDNDLNLDPELQESQELTIDIASKPEPYNLIVTESGKDTGAFFGLISFSKGEIGSIQIENGDFLTMQYVDLDPGIEGSRIITESTVMSCTTTSATRFIARDVADDNGGNVELFWEPSPDDGRNENDIDKYVLLRADASSLGLLNFKEIMQLPAGTRRAVDTQAFPTTEYFYILRTVDFYGNDASTTRIGPVTGIDNIPPEPPMNIRAEDLGLGDSILLEWDHLRSEQTIGYMILFDTNSGWPYEGKGSDYGDSPIEIGLENSFVVSGLTTDREYFFTIRAREETGARSLLSEEVSSKPTKVDFPIILAAGLSENFVTYGQEVTVQAFLQEGTFPIDNVEVYYTGLPTGIFLDQVWSEGSNLMYSGKIQINPVGEIKNKIIIELKSTDSNGFQSNMWPYLNVPEKPGNGEVPNTVQYSQFDWGNSSFSLFQNPYDGPKILVGGFWDTKIDPKVPANILKVMVYVLHPEGREAIDSVGLFYNNTMTEMKFNDDGLNGDANMGDGIYTYRVELGAYPLPGLYVVPVVARDIDGNYSNLFPFVHIKDMIK